MNHDRINNLLLVAFIVLTMLFPITSSADDISYSPTVEAALSKVKINFVDDYLDSRPRILFSIADIPQLKKKSVINPDRWVAVEQQASRLASHIPDSQTIRNGADRGRYVRSEWILSGALAYTVTGNTQYRDNAIKWMVAHCKEDVWGTQFNPNTDLIAAWYLYYISLAYDILYHEIPDADKQIIRQGLIDHARIMYESKLPPQQYRFEQNHTYIPSTGLAAAALALYDETPEAEDWLKIVNVLMDRARWVLGTDGYYYEGYGYWVYALNWHVRYADLMSKATGQDMYNLDILKKNHLFGLYLSLPQPPYGFDIGDGGKGANGRETTKRFAWHHMLYRLASIHRNSEIQGVTDYLKLDATPADDPSMHFLWYDETVKSNPYSNMPPYHYFDDHEIVSWRSSWDKDATCYLFRAGPPQGHAATTKLEALRDWKMNSGHVHPDIGMFWIYSNGQFMATDTGYLANKFTDDHNTLLVDDHGQGDDGSYWVYRGLPYDKFDHVKIDAVQLTPSYGYISADIAAAYHPQEQLKLTKMQRYVVMTKQYMLVYDDIASDMTHEYTWLLHTDHEMKETGQRFTARQGDMRLVTFPVKSNNNQKLTPEIGPTMVMAGNSPLKGVEEQRGYQLALKTDKQHDAKFINALFSLTEDQSDPQSVELLLLSDQTLQIRIVWGAYKVEIVTVNLDWESGHDTPAVIFENS